jgi:hypothetical protein
MADAERSDKQGRPNAPPGRRLRPSVQAHAQFLPRGAKKCAWIGGDIDCQYMDDMSYKLLIGADLHAEWPWLRLTHGLDDRGAR